MADQDLFDRFSDLDPYDREERCRKAIRTLLKAIAMRVAAGVLLIVAVIRAGAAPIALGLSAFAMVIIVTGVLPLIREMKKQRALINECIALQERLEQSK